MSSEDKVTEPNRNKNSNIWPPHLGIQTEIEKVLYIRVSKL